MRKTLVPGQAPAAPHPECHLLSRPALRQVLAAAIFLPAAQAAVVNPYVADANTIALYHFDETSGTIVNQGSAGSSLDLTNTGGANGRGNGGGGYGATGYAGFGNAFNVLNSGDGTYHAVSTAVAAGGGAATGAAVAQSSLQGASGAFTLEATVYLTGGMVAEQNILAHDGLDMNRGFLFRVVNNQLSLYAGGPDVRVSIPTTGEHAFANNEWFHVAVAYSGAQGSTGNLIFYWTALGSTATEANSIGSGTLASDVAASSNPLGIGTTTRNPYRYEVQGLIDEVRVSDIGRAPDAFIFVPEPATACLAAMGGLAFASRRKRR